MSQPPPLIPNEVERLAALGASGLVYSPAEERFDRVTRLATHALEVPIALVSLIGESRQWFKSVQGLEATETPREVAFCVHAIAAGDKLVVEDAANDLRFADNPLVTGNPRIRAYAGNVIRTPAGHPLGTLCVIDSKPRQFSKEELARLADLAAIVQAEIGRAPSGVQAEYLKGFDEKGREQRLDAGSLLLNHDAMLELLMGQVERGEKDRRAFMVALVRIAQVGQMGSRFGEEATAAAMREVGSALRRVLSEGDAVGRFDGETFIVLLTQASNASTEATAQRLREAVTLKPIQAGRISIRLVASAAAETWQPGTSLVALLESTAAAL